MQKIIFAACLMLSFMQLPAQDCNYSLQGIVQDFHDGEKLELAQIYIVSLQKTFSTDAQGRFIIKNLCAGSYKLRISHVSCETKNIELDIDADRYITIKLEHHLEDLDQINITADVHDDHGETQSITRVSENTIEDNSGATLGDALATVPGVSILKTGNSVTKPMIHGLYGSRVAIVNDGIRQYDQEWGVEHAPNIDVNTAGSIQVVKGASSLRYGTDAVGGTIVIEPERVILKDTIKGKFIAQLQSNGQGGTVTGAVQNYNDNGWFQQGTLTYKRLADFESPDYILNNTGSQTAAANLALGYKSFEYGASLKYSFYDTEIGILRASHSGSASSFVRSLESERPIRIENLTYEIDPPKQAVQHHGVQLNAYKRLSGLGRIEVDYAFQFNNRLEFDIRRGENRNKPSLDIDLYTQNLMSYLFIDRYENTQIEIGMDATYQFNTSDPDTGIRRLIPDYESLKLGGFASINHELNNEWLLDAGLRYDYYNIDAEKFYISTRWADLGYDEQFPQFEISEENGQIFTNPVFDFNLFAFTVGAKYFAGNHNDIAMNLSTANRAPNPSEFFSDGLHHALATIELGRLDLEKEQSYKLNLVFHRAKGALDFEINPYLNLVNDFIQLVPTGLETTTRGAFQVYQYEQVNALLAGFDFSSSWNILYPQSLNLANESLILNSRFSYIYGQDTIKDEALIDMPPPAFFNEIIWGNGLLDDFKISLSNETVLKQTRFPNNDFMAEVFDDDGNSSMVNVGISESPDAYSLWNIGFGYAFAKASINLRVNNVLNTSYRNYLNRQRFFADDIGRDIQLQFIYRF